MKNTITQVYRVLKIVFLFTLLNVKSFSFFFFSLLFTINKHIGNQRNTKNWGFIKSPTTFESPVLWFATTNEKNVIDINEL